MRFTFHRPTGVEVSTCCHRPSGGDVAGRVDVGVPGVTAGPTTEDGLALARFRIDGLAHRTRLGRVRGRYLLHPTGCLVLKPRHEIAPPVGEDAPVQRGLLDHVAARIRHGSSRGASHGSNVEVLDPNHVVASRQIGRGLLHPILTSIGLAGPQPRDGRLRLVAAVRSALCSRKAALQPPQPLGLRGSQSRAMQQIPARQGSGSLYSPVHPDYLTAPGRGNRVGYGGERDVPAASRVSGDPVRHGGWHRARHPELDPAHLRDPHRTSVAVQLAYMPRFDRHDSEPVMPAELAPRRSSMRAGEEVRHCLGEVPKRLLLHHLRARPQPLELPSGLGQLPRLLVVAGRMSAAAPTPMRLLLNGFHTNRACEQCSNSSISCVGVGVNRNLAIAQILTACTDTPTEGGSGDSSWTDVRGCAPRLR